MNKDISLRNKHFETRAGLILQTTLNHTFDQSITKVQMPKRMGCKQLVQMHIVMQSEVTRGNFDMKIGITPQTTNIKELNYLN